MELLSHENTDISLDVVELLSELTDPEAVAETEEALALLDALVTTLYFSFALFSLWLLLLHLLLLPSAFS